MEEEEEEDTLTELKAFTTVQPQPRFRSHSDTSGFTARILWRLRGGRTVDGLEKSSSLASCDMVADGGSDGHGVPVSRQQRGKLSSLGRLFKPWKWRKKKSSDRFQDLSKVLERKISTRQTREELIKKGVLVSEQDEPVCRENQNGHATSSMSPEQVKVEIETKLTQPADPTPGPDSTEDKTAKSSHPKKTQGSSAKVTTTTSHPTIPPRSRLPKDAEAQSTGADTRTGRKAEANSQKASAEVPSQPEEVNSSEAHGSSGQVPPPEVEEAPVGSQAAPEDKAPSAESSASQENPAEASPVPAVHSHHVNTSTEDTSFREGDAQGDAQQEKELRMGGEGGEAQEENGEPAEDTHCSSPANADTIKPQGLSVSIHQIEVTVIPDRPSESQASDSDSDGPILYRDDEEEEEEDEYLNSSLASKIRRRDTLNIKLGNRPSKRELEEKNILPRSSETERHELRQQIGSKLVRRLSQRPTTEELEQRNILRQKNEDEEHEAKQEIKRKLSRKLSVRPTVAELIARRILRFNEYVEVTDAKDYDRRADKPWTRLTPADKAAIRKELNEFKSKEMEVHENSKHFTRFHRP
ncbi:phosphatase and actin regulator 2 isoform X5 [Syngnathus acus]|uniref:phosphatase and actin regulator 2 isoform X5 n=1 Tax=Syngnathus acus TaxID=161584 RepID=UPI0018861CA8|nr:phosphatase and actin regulator 2 isoform X5 [Syngnathus acus]